MATTGQAIREALNERIYEIDQRILKAGVDRKTLAAISDDLTEFRVEVNRILHDAGEL
jgi:F0F1-type ATP synthase membrane subunit b/b'